MEAYDYNVHSTIDFHCEHGHQLVGEASLVCQPDGEWSGESPKCECKTCVHYKDTITIGCWIHMTMILENC